MQRVEGGGKLLPQKQKMEKKKKKMENLNEEREIRTDKEMIKRKCKTEKKNGGKFEQRKRRKNR